MTGKCPICGAERGDHGTNAAFPFCSHRCQMVDLGKWLGEEYCISEPIDPKMDDSGLTDEQREDEAKNAAEFYADPDWKP